MGSVDAHGVQLYERYGWPGSEVPGSKYYRGYCMMCGEPIRVKCWVNARDNLCTCEDCLQSEMHTSNRVHMGNRIPSVPVSEAAYQGFEMNSGLGG